jgi:hypothetical protein
MRRGQGAGRYAPPAWTPPSAAAFDLVICLALFLAGLAALRPIVVAMSRILPMPCACLNPNRPTPIEISSMLSVRMSVAA